MVQKHVLRCHVANELEIFIRTEYSDNCPNNLVLFKQEVRAFQLSGVRTCIVLPPGE